MSGACIQYGEKRIEENKGRREFVKWESAIDELYGKGFIKK